MPSLHLHPMSADSLRPRPAPQAAAFGAPVRLSAPVQPAPAPELPAEETPPEEPVLPDDLLTDDFLLFAEDDEDENEPDAVPTETMPIPVCVPLYEVSLADIPRSKRKK